ncbi:hypothetical protein POM88_016238 [Heracleum sosnowskyi]|uniref:BZIP domain-containing protein n=1 Tax=Heracleum sosnowskyi TaxID=360622 RepID=A0AAD8IQ74_9APIA|nr:hypothetical protein POM88_016238 [Heracleum sosnowskyi]
MEEIWKDIPNLSSLKNPNSSLDAKNLQEFLARPFLYPNYNLNNLVFPETKASPTNLFHASPVTCNGVLLRPQGNSLSSHPAVSNMICPSQKQQHLGLAIQTSCSARKRVAIRYENDDQNDSSFHSDRHHQRLIKNRESTARSRDRKEAHTTDLENQLKTLKAENATLKKNQQLQEAPQALKKHTLNRASSYPL